MTPSESAAVESVLARSRSLGFLGPGSLRVQVEHALGFAAGPVGSAGATPRRVLDLGSGGGVPGLVLAHAWPDTEMSATELIERLNRLAADIEAAAGAAVAENRRRAELRSELDRESRRGRAS